MSENLTAYRVTDHLTSLLPAYIPGNDTDHKITDYIASLPASWRLVFGGVFTFTSFFIIFENVIILVIIYKYPILWRKYKILAVLTFYDFLSGVVTVPLFAWKLFDQFNTWANTARLWIAPVLGFSSINLTVFLSYDRYLHIKMLGRYEMSRKKFSFVTSICLLLPIVIASLRSFDDRVLIIVGTIAYFIGYSLMVYFYIQLVVALKNYTSENSINISANKERRATRTVVMIATTHILTHLPFIINGVVSKLVSSEDDGKRYVLVFYLMVSNSGLNPFIYYYRTPQLYKHAAKLFPFLDNRVEPTREDVRIPQTADGSRTLQTVDCVQAGPSSKHPKVKEELNIIKLQDMQVNRKSVTQLTCIEEGGPTIVSIHDTQLLNTNQVQIICENVGGRQTTIEIQDAHSNLNKLEVQSNNANEERRPTLIMVEEAHQNTSNSQMQLICENTEGRNLTIQIEDVNHQSKEF